MFGYKKFVTYSQHDAMDCGPTCLKMIFKYYGKVVNLESLKKASQIESTGVSLLGLSEAAEKYGFRTIGAKLTFQQLMTDATLPCILHWDQYHFVVLTPSSDEKSLQVADPARGLIRLSTAEFLKYWISIDSGSEQRGIVLLLMPRAVFYQQDEDSEHGVNWTVLFKYAAIYRRELAQLVIGLMIGSLLQFIFPFLTQNIVDTGIATQNLHFIQLVLIAQFALFCGQLSVEFVRSRILLFVSTQVNLAILSDFWIKLMRLPMNFFETRRTGDILQRINDHRRIDSFITGPALQSVFSILNLVIFSIVLLIYSQLIFLVFIGGGLFHFVWIRIFMDYRRRLDYRTFTASSKESAITMQLINGMHEIKLNNAEHLKRWEWEKLQGLLFKLNFTSLSLIQYQQAGSFFINQGKNLLITYLVAKDVLAGNLTLGGMLAIQYMIGQLNSPIEQLTSFARIAQDAKISLERLNEIHVMDEEEDKDMPFVNELSDDLSIILRDLSFTYNGAGNSPVLSNISVTFPSGKVTAIVGASGSGKTTILKLLQKFYLSYSGEIRIGESNLKNVSPYYWRTISGSVMQDGYIFSDTIARNIAISDEITNYQKLINAAKVANVLSFIETLPFGFNTVIGDDGNGVSTGQRQRILIARAVYKNPRFILFDEATNALDANNESCIMENLKRFLDGRTVIIVAHRLSTVKTADKIIVLDQGRVVEEGTHLELTQKQGRYFNLLRNQMELLG